MTTPQPGNTPTLELLPCPFCGKNATGRVSSSYDIFDHDDGSGENFAVFCDASNPHGLGGCGASGGFFDTKEQAISAWNRRELHSIRSAELPVEPDIQWLHKFINCVPFGAHAPVSDIKRAHQIIDALKAYALKEKERADLNLDNLNLTLSDLGLAYMRAEKAESELAALRGRIMEPSEEMVNTRPLLQRDVFDVEPNPDPYSD